MQTCIRVFIVVAALLTAPAIASSLPLINQGTTTFDPATGLIWLDVTLTVNRSYAEVESQFGLGGEFSGYRYATSGEVSTLFTHAGITNPYIGWGEEVDAMNYYVLMDLLGFTRENSDYWRTEGLVSGQSIALLELVGLCVLGGPVSCLQANASHSQVSRNDRGSFGSFLVQDDLSPVPAPAAFTLFVTGLGALGLLGWRRRRAATQ